jgi:hypothetical protein
MSKDSGSGNVKNIVEPWEGLKPYLTGAYGDAESQYQQGAPSYYGGQTVAPMSGYTKGALDSMAQRAADGSPLVRSAQSELNDTLSGSYLEAGNPYFQGAVNAATRPITESYNNEVMPGLMSDFSAAGRYGSNANQSMAESMSGRYLDAIGDVSSQMAYQNYGDERQRMMQGMLFAPELASQDYKDIGMLGQAGLGYDQYNQSLIDADKAEWDYNQTADMQHIANYLGLLNGSPYQTQITKGAQPGMNPFTGALGGAATGFGIGGLPGALIGGGLGVLGGIFG